MCGWHCRLLPLLPAIFKTDRSIKLGAKYIKFAVTASHLKPPGVSLVECF